VAIAIGINTWSCGCFVSRGDRYELARRRKKEKKGEKRKEMKGKLTLAAVSSIPVGGELRHGCDFCRQMFCSLLQQKVV